MNILKIYILILIFTVISSVCTGQAKVSCSFSADTLVTGYGQTFSNKLRFENKSDKTINLILGINTEESLLKLPDTINIQPGVIKIIPVKYLCNPDLLTKSFKKISVNYLQSDDKIPVSASFVVRLNQPEKILLYPEEPIVYINNNTGTVQFKLYCVNKGYAKTNIQLKLTVNPVGMQILNPVKNIILDAGEEQLIDCEARLIDNNKSSYSPEFNITVEGTDTRGNNLATALIHVTALESNKRQVALPGQLVNELSNTTELGYATFNKAYTYVTAHGQGNMAPTENSALSYSLNLNYYDHQRALEGYDTWVNYRNKTFGVRAGNIMANLDFSLYGRGVVTSLYLNKHNGFDFYYVHNSYLLFSQLTNQWPAASTFAGSYNYSSAGNRATASVLFSQNPATGINTRFTNGFAHFEFPNNQRIEIKAGYSNEVNQKTNETKAGQAAGFLYTLRSHLFDINLNNYYSTAFYSGLQRGNTQLENQLNFHINRNLSLFGHYELLKSSPRYLIDTITIFGFYNNTLKYEAGFNLNFNKISLTLHPYIYKQNINETYNNSFFHITSPLASTAYRLGFDINYTLSSNQQLYITSDFGHTKSNNPALYTSVYNGLRLNASYTNKWWGLSTLIQTAPYYLSEEFVAANVKQLYKTYSFGPNIHYTSPNNKINVAVNDYLNFATYNIKRNNALNAQVSYRYKGDFRLSAQVFYNTYSVYNNNYNLQTRVAISKQFLQTSIPGANNLQLRFFEDENSDGIMNGNEKPLEGAVVNLIPDNGDVSNLTTVTGKKGEVSYTNLQKTTYTLTVLRGNGWHLAGSMSINMVRDHKMMVPLVKSGWLKGTIVPVKQEYANSTPLLEGLRVVATDKNNQTYTTLTNEAGEFEIALPLNSYNVTVDIDRHKYSISNPNQDITVVQNGNKTVKFDIIDESRQVIVRVF